jgi:hypothetical protein
MMAGLFAMAGQPAGRMTVMRGLVDVSYNPSDPPYVMMAVIGHAEGSTHTAYREDLGKLCVDV